jgi:hypothetical protein
MTESPALHDEDCEASAASDFRCACSYRASIVALEREVKEQAAKHADCCVDRQEREEDRQAIRALKEDHDVSGWTKGNPCTCEVCREHAAAIQRAQARP